MAVEASPDAGLVQEFANTRDLRTFVPRGHPYRDGTRDDLGSPAAVHGWLTDRGLLPYDFEVSESDHARVLDLRARLRAALDRTRYVDHGEDASPFAVPLQVELDARDGPRLTSADNGVNQAVGEICAAALRTALSGEWWRLRTCAADDCRWVFYDQSKPGRGRYCAPDTCGNRVKTRSYRRRRKDGGPADDRAGRARRPPAGPA
ncbi:MAG: CGNR zinc finger domain-containing protein [Nocardioidaceae bacterium]